MPKNPPNKTWRLLGFHTSPYNTDPLKPAKADKALLVGRGKEAVQFATTLDSDTNGVYVIGGSPGVGKTSFLNVQQYTLEAENPVIGPSLLAARHLCVLQHNDSPRKLAERALSSLLNSVRDYCESIKEKVPSQTKKVAAWFSGTHATSVSLNLQVFGFGVGGGRTITVPKRGDMSLEHIRQVIVAEVRKSLGKQGVFIVLDNIENLTQTKITEMLMCFRDTMFQVPHVWWVLIGQRGLGSMLQAADSRVWERTSGPGLDLDPITPNQLHSAIDLRVQRFHDTGTKAPLSKEIHDKLYRVSDGEIRFIFKHSNDICLQFVASVTTELMRKLNVADLAEGERMHKELHHAIGKQMAYRRIPDGVSMRLLTENIESEVSGLALSENEVAILRNIGDAKSASASHHIEFGYQTYQKFTKALEKLHSKELLVRAQVGRSTQYALRGIALLALEQDVL